MTLSPTAPIFADAALNGWLAAMGLGVEYVRAEGDSLFYLDGDGREIPVLDLACGFGSLIFGHNNSEIVTVVKSALDAQVPVHAQLSWQSHANTVAARLNSIVQRETGTATAYSAIFANSGAEAIEICMKHAELERQARISALCADIGTHIDEARAAVRDGHAVTEDGTGLDDLVATLERENAGRLSRRPVFLTLEHSFHGKLVGSIQLTQNEQWRNPFSALASVARFVPADQPGTLAKIVEDERASLLDLAVGDGRVRVVERDLPTIAAFFVEPIRGGAGMKPVTAEFARAIEQACATTGCPLVVDEVQSGMGRSGAFLASSHMGLRGDYYTLAKSIGGGVVKNAVALVRQDRFRAEFEVIHSSTFAKDGLSGAVAIKVLDMLEADGGKAYRTAADLGARLTTMLESVHSDFPDVVRGVHGLGLMLAIELADQSAARSEVIREHARSGVLGFLLAGFLLREHRIRVLPAGPGWNFIRFEPSIHLTDADIRRTESALRSLCTVLREQDGQRLVPHQS